MSQHRDAIAAYETAIGLKMDHTSAWNNLGLLYEDLSKNQKKKEKKTLCMKCHVSVSIYGTLS